MKKSQVFSLWLILSAGVCLLVYYKFIDRQWFEAVYMIVIGFAYLLTSLYLIRAFNRWSVHLEVDQADTFNIGNRESIIMRLPKKGMDDAVPYSFGFYASSLATVYCSDELWTKWLAYLVAFLLMLVEPLS